MRDVIAIETERLRLRTWEPDDLAQFIRLTNTPTGMRYLGGVAGPEIYQGLYERILLSQQQNGFCFWIAERREDRAMLGICGFKRGTVDPIIDAMEIGWRFREDVWGQGYAREAAAACLDWGWRNVPDDRIVAITVIGNTSSWGLMERLGMRRNLALDFDHPNHAVGDPFRPHITYEIARRGAGGEIARPLPTENGR
ncbi:MAG: GNAT family N-acetyltransferase [Pseudomonadota bacterium]